MPAAVGDLAQFLDIDVNQLPRARLLVTSRRRTPNRQSRGLVQMVKQRHRIPFQDPPDCRARNTQVIADSVRTPAASETQRNDAPLELLRRARRAAARSRTAISQRLAGPIPTSPLRRGRGRALEPFRRAANRPAILNDQPSQASPALRGEGRVSVSHEDLRGNDMSVVTHIVPGGLRLPQAFTTCRGTTARRRAGSRAVGADAQRAMSAIRAFVIRCRSAGASSMSKPRRPPLTKIVSNSSTVSSRTVGSAVFWPTGLIPPTR